MPFVVMLNLTIATDVYYASKQLHCTKYVADTVHAVCIPWQLIDQILSFRND